MPDNCRTCRLSRTGSRICARKPKSSAGRSPRWSERTGCRSSWSRAPSRGRRNEGSLATKHNKVGVTHEMIDITNERYAISSQMSMIFLRPVRNYFYWEPHCYDIPVCSAVRSGFDASDGEVDRISQKTRRTSAGSGQRGFSHAAVARASAAADRSPERCADHDVGRVQHHVGDRSSRQRNWAATEQPIWGRISTPPKMTTLFTYPVAHSTTRISSVS